MKRIIKYLSIIFLAALILLLPQPNIQAADKKDATNAFVIAKVNNKIITNFELIDRYNFVLFSSKISINSAWERKNLLEQIIDKMIDEELIKEEATSYKIEVSESEVIDAFENVALQQKKNPTQFKIALIERNLSYANYLKQIEAELAWSKLVSEVLRSKVKITDAEVNEYFEQRKFNTNIIKFFLAEIFIPESENGAIVAKKLVAELRSGADFKSIVKQFSRDNLTAENGGELGWVAQNDIDPKIYAAISKLKKNEYSNPVFSNDGYYIFKVVNTKFESKVADNDLNLARNNIFVKKLQNLAKGHLADLRKKAFIEISRDKIGELRF
ncbi:MAG: peptidylprolyl isomerase [Rickettsiales bacterium]|nr:peptidylprolyl isomerase [Rickettsiales bacterium]